MNKVNVFVDKLHLCNNWYLDLTASTHINNNFMRFAAIRPKWQASSEIGRQKFFTLLWTPLAHQEALSKNYAMHAVLC